MNQYRSLLVLAALLAGCSTQPPTPDWLVEAHGALERFSSAYLRGDARVEAAEFARARSAVASTGRLDLLARAELTRCAVRVASLVLEPCAGFDALRADAAPPERAYADYLAARVQPQDVPLLPAAHRSAAAGDTQAVKAVADPLARLVAAGVLFQAGRASPDLLALAVDTASAQGWRRPLLAWLGVQARRAEAAGAVDEAARIRRRMALVGANG